MNKKLSSVLITKNEEDNLERCLSSIKDISEEIVIVDSGSADNTLLIAKRFNAKIFERKFDDFATQRNFALSKANNEWILSLDADEEITNDLKKEITGAINSDEYDAYLIPRKNIIFGKEIKHTRWSPDKHIWLFRKSKSKYINSIHEEVQLNGSIGELSNSKIHYSHKDVYEFLDKTNFYTDFESKKFNNIKGYSVFGMIIDVNKSFVGRFIVKKGFLDGWRGFVLSYLRAIYKLILWVKVWEQEQK